MENKMFELMEKMYAEMQNGFKQVNERIDNLEDWVNHNHNEVMSKLNRLEDKFDDLEPKNATRHSEINLKLDTISKEVKFIKHKLHETEEDVFDIKDHLKIIK